MKKPTSLVTLIAIMWLSFAVHAEAPDANAIITKAYEIPRVNDQITTLSFTFSAPGKKEQQVVYTMVWKKMKDEEGCGNKAMFFTESPPDKRGIIYTWLAQNPRQRQGE